MLLTCPQVTSIIFACDNLSKTGTQPQLELGGGWAWAKELGGGGMQREEKGQEHGTNTEWQLSENYPISLLNISGTTEGTWAEPTQTLPMNW